MQMTNYSFLRAAFLSFYSRPFYRHVAVGWRGVAYVYLLLVLAACWLPFLVEVYGNWSRFMSTQAKDLLEQIPAVSVLNGSVSADVPQPHFIRSRETEKVLLILDTTGQIQSLKNVDAQILVTRTQFMVKKGARETRIYDLSAIQHFTIDRDRVGNWLKLASVWGPPALYVFLVVLSFAYRLLQSLLLGLVALVVRQSLGSSINYVGALSVALVAATPAVIAKTVLDILGLVFPFRELLILAVAFGYLCLGLRSTVMPPEIIKGAGYAETTPN